MPSFAAIERIPAYSVSSSPRCSATSRTARSRSSLRYCLGIEKILPNEEVSLYPGGDSLPPVIRAVLRSSRGSRSSNWQPSPSRLTEATQAIFGRQRDGGPVPGCWPGAGLPPGWPQGPAPCRLAPGNAMEGDLRAAGWRQTDRHASAAGPAAAYPCPQSWPRSRSSRAAGGGNTPGPPAHCWQWLTRPARGGVPSVSTPAEVSMSRVKRNRPADMAANGAWDSAAGGGSGEAGCGSSAAACQERRSSWAAPRARNARLGGAAGRAHGPGPARQRRTQGLGPAVLGSAAARAREATAPALPQACRHRGACGCRQRGRGSCPQPQEAGGHDLGGRRGRGRGDTRRADA
jgi:hypothetical protein